MLNSGFQVSGFYPKSEIRRLESIVSWHTYKCFCIPEERLSAKIADASDPKAIEEAARIIRKGGLVAFPTETVYGLGADAGNPLAVAQIFEVKARPRIDPLIIHVADIESAERYGKLPESARKLATKFWPGPLTLVVNKRSSVPPIVTAGLETVAIRIPAHPAALDLIRASGCGIAAPSANPFGYVSPTEARHVEKQLGDAIDMILDGGPCAIGLESTILSLTGVEPCIYRVGGTAIEDIESILGTLHIQIDTSSQPLAPGQLKKHYATQTRLEIVSEAQEYWKPKERVGLLSMIPPKDPSRYAAVEVLSPSGNLREAAANLFRALRQLDAQSLDRIIARPVQEEGLGLAIMDRLRRCAAR
jgi:L-threonylcarbamoyladenylate synthase